MNYDNRNFFSGECVDKSTRSYSYQINQHDLKQFQKEFETASKSLKRNKASGNDDINNNIVLDFFEELKTP